MMNDDMLSQEEIDALLRGSDDEIDSSNDDELQAGSEKNDRNIDDYLLPLEKDALGEIGNISFGSSATALSSLLNQKVDITTPTTSLIEREKLTEEFPQPHVAVKVTYTEGFSGENILVIRSKDAAIIADLMLGGDGTSPAEELNEIHLSAVQEAMNQMMGSAATSMSAVFNKRVDISPPNIDVMDPEENNGSEQIPDEDILIKVSFNLKVGELIDSNIMQLLPCHFAKELVDQLLNPPGQEEEHTANEEDSLPSDPEPSVQRKSNSHNTAGSEGQLHTSNQDSSPPQYIGSMSQHGQAKPNVETAQFSSFGGAAPVSKEQRNLDMLLDIPLKVTVELGRTQRTIKDILELSSGSVVELDKLAGEPVDIHVNNKLIAQGEVVVIDENFGVRVTDILSPKDRLRKIK
ncbi:flagellar motor switch phosphatase FliY [Thalassobacillus pellis]|uniref:flagellar motor switch phosphatase FliY n=1 Tax=Thalassobacillus pellis TaxID=748008 RepID=UPI0019617164|nr:flagellar motor switch phosphatase FliY [Thalassobacillus pellis]MBM7552740.1 flagellar motor switch protein FliN/FliY [Thalassobacillus pellis]